MSREDFTGPDLGLIANNYPEFYELAKKYDEDGYAILNLDISTNFNVSIIEDIKNIITKSTFKKNPEIYHYNESPRIVEAWKQSMHIKDLALNPDILNVLTALYGKKPLPFSTINFVRGTEQPLHSDYIHFGSLPEFYLAGAWVALEDISKDCGPLSIVKGSHKTPIISFQDLGFEELPTTTKKIKEYYTRYEDWLSGYIKDNNLEIETPLLKAGQVLIWSANLFHGAQKINNPKLTRYSQVTHYHFDGCEKFYNPNFSNRKLNKFAERDVLSSIIS